MAGPGRRTGRPSPSRSDRWAEATARLAAADPSMGAFIARWGPCTLGRRRTAGGAFGALARAICHQQLAGAAAGAIHARFVALYGGRPTPAAVADTPDAVLAAAGLSGAKAASIKDLAAKVLAGSLRLDGWERSSDDDIVERLTAVRGIGQWTAHMFLVFELNRPDVWPVGDLGVRTGYGRIHGLQASPSPAQLIRLGEAYRPYRTIAAWYCWRAVGPEPAWVTSTRGDDHAPA